jgi:hypothetical protein
LEKAVAKRVGRPKFRITEEEVDFAIEWFMQKIDPPAAGFPGKKRKEPALTHLKKLIASRDADALNAWCDENMSPIWWRRLRDTVGQKRLRARKSDWKTIDISLAVDDRLEPWEGRSTSDKIASALDAAEANQMIFLGKLLENTPFPVLESWGSVLPKKYKSLLQAHDLELKSSSDEKVKAKTRTL